MTRATLPGGVKRELDEVVRRAQLGDTVAFSELFTKHRAIVARVAYRMMGPSADLEDIIQDVFLQVYRSLPAFRGQSKFTTWLHRVTVNVVLMARRRARSRPSYASDEVAVHEPAPGPRPDHDVTRARRLAAFQRLLDRLSEKKRSVFILHELEGLRATEVAKLVGCPVLTVRTRLFYARKELAEMMRVEPVLAQLIDQGEREAAPPTSQDRPSEVFRQEPQTKTSKSQREAP